MASEVLTIRADRVSWRVIEDEAVLLDLAASEYLSLNRSATVLWNALHEGTDMASLIDVLRSHFGVAEHIAVEDVNAFLILCDQRSFLGRSPVAQPA